MIPARLIDHGHRFLLVICLMCWTHLSCHGLHLDQRPSLSPSLISRRQVVTDRLSKILVAGACWTTAASPANAARGAAELDLEFYLRDAFGGNLKQGTVGASAPPPLPPPRSLQEPLLSLLLNDECSLSCIPCKALAQQLQKGNKSPVDRIEADIQRRVAYYRDGPAGRSFGKRAMWQIGHVSDQYYFDLTSYSFWRATSELLPNFVDRFEFMRSLGKLMYQQTIEKELLKHTFSKPVTLSQTNLAVTEMLDLFASSNYCKGYRFTEQQQGSSATAAAPGVGSKLFDEYDDDYLASGASVNVLVSIYDPATLGACLQLTGEQSRFWPDFIAPSLAALWETALPGIQVNWEVYFVDSTYRPNPKDYFPDEQLFQFTLTRL